MNPENPEYPQWLESQDVEKLRVFAYDTWRRLSSQEEQSVKDGTVKAVPTCVLFNRKRCGRYKARIIILGDRWNPNSGDPVDVYAGTISQVANRVLLTESASRRWHLQAYDVTNAFLRARIDRLVVVRIPEDWRDCSGHDNGLRALKRALYGLPISPRLWARAYHDDLLRLGYVGSKLHPGLYVYRDPISGKITKFLSVSKVRSSRKSNVPLHRCLTEGGNVDLNLESV